jgi:hypothetical protein
MVFGLVEVRTGSAHGDAADDSSRDAGAGSRSAASDAGERPSQVPPSERWDPAGVATDEGRAVTDDLDPGGFALYAFSPSAVEPVVATTRHPSERGDVIVSWPPAAVPAAVVLYRVVCSDAHQPFSPDEPDEPDLLIVTRATSVVDHRAGSGAVRHYAVYANAGRDVAEAKKAQPDLHATASMVLSVRRPSLRVDGSVVIGTWDTGAGTVRVDVLRIPPARAATAPNDLESFGVSRNSLNLRGFRDDAVSPGSTYVYRVLAVAEIDGVEHQARPFVVSVAVAAPVEPVTDLTVGADPGTGSPGTVALTWTRPPVGRVDVYRTPDGPAPGAQEETALREENLLRLRLGPDDLVAYPQVDDGTACGIHGVSWPRGWARATFTPVTVHDGKVQVGRSVTVVRPRAIADVELVERVSWQHLTFAWPEGASHVNVYAGPKGQPLPDPPGQPFGHIDEATYLDQGGLRLSGSTALRTVSGAKIDLHLVPVMFYEGRAHMGEPVRVGYAGLWRLSYRFTRAGGRGRREQLEVRSSLRMARVPELRLIHRPDRLPLSSQDGAQLGESFRLQALPTNEWVVAGPIPDVPVGFIRLFADHEPDFPFMTAVTNPDISSLRRRR